jgi:HEAT repeat protein
MEKPVEFDQIIAALLDNSVPFPPVLLYNLSGIHPTEYQQLAGTWPQIAVERRRALLEDLDQLADKDFLLDFDNVGRIGLHDPDAVVCINAISLLWQAEDKRLVPELIAFMKSHADEGVRAAAASALGPYVYMGEVERLPEKLLHEIEEALLAAIKNDQSLHVRRRALEALGYSCREEVENLINTASQSKDTLWLESALCAIGRSADNFWDKKVLSFLDHPAPEVQIAAIHAAGDLGIERARLPLLEMLAEGPTDQELRAELIWALSQIGGGGVQDIFETILDSTDDPDETELIEEALDNLSFTEDSTAFNLLDVDFDEDDLNKKDFNFDDEDDDF